MTSTRGVQQIMKAPTTLEGEGFEVRRPFPQPALNHVDPFLLLDEFGPKDIQAGEGKGAPDHPHRGFETVTYMLQGAFEHRDSQGNHGELHAGDVQWMTAGAGIVHSEMPSRAFQKTGGRLHGFQLWVNLPARDKMMRPRYQEVPARNIPSATSPDGKVSVSVIAGQALGASAAIDTRTPIAYLHFTIQPGGAIVQPIARGHNAMAYVFAGDAAIGNESVSAGHLAILDATGDSVSLGVPADAAVPAQLLLLSGQPLREPVERYGPFVMNTRAELHQAVADFQSGRMGSIRAG